MLSHKGTCRTFDMNQIRKRLGRVRVINSTQPFKFSTFNPFGFCFGTCCSMWFSQTTVLEKLNEPIELSKCYIWVAFNEREFRNKASAKRSDLSFVHTPFSPRCAWNFVAAKEAGQLISVLSTTGCVPIICTIGVRSEDAADDLWAHLQFVDSVA